MSVNAYIDLQRFQAFEALLATYAESMTREEARERLAAWNLGPERQEAARAWFDLRWPE